MKFKFFFLFIIFLTIQLLSSCTHIVELDDLAIFSGVGFDIGTNKKLATTIQIILHRQLKVQAQGGFDDVTTNVIVAGDNLIEISRDFTLISGRKGVWSHAKVIIISEELAKSGIGEIIAILERDNEIRGTTYLCISKGKAEAILSADTTKLETIQAFNISDMIEMYTRNGKSIPVDLLRYSVTTSPNNDNAFITGISLIPEEETDSKSKNRLQLDGTAILKKDIFVGWFDEIETRGLLWVLGEIKSCIVDIEYPQTRDPISIEIHSASAKIIPVFENQTIKMIKIEVECTGSIAQSNSNVQLMKLGEFKKIEEKAAEQIEKEIYQSIEKAKEYHADVFGFNEAVNNKEPSIFEILKNNWDQIFSTLQVETDVTLKLNTTGLTKEE